jgi:antitoxin (DNA-binding transcriptional repressor) of toxin-antitoxin stability system
VDLRGEGGGLERLSRLVEQRLREQNGMVRIAAVEPLIEAMLDDVDLYPWEHKHLERVVREWLRSLVVARVPEGEALRIRLRDRVVAACVAADRRLAEEQAQEAARLAARTSEEVEADESWAAQHRGLWRMLAMSGTQKPARKRGELPRELTNDGLIEILALLGPDLGADGEEILRRVATNEPWSICPAVEELFVGTALSMYRRGFLAEITEAYYLDDEEDGSGFHEDGIRDHHSRSFEVTPLAAWYRGPFMALFLSDFRDGVAMLNRLLNHAAATRVRTLAGLHQFAGAVDEAELNSYRVELEITGARQEYVGDPHVWCWYRGTAVGPYPCISALQALERVCDQLLGIGVPLSNVVGTLLDGCENLAMVGLVVSILIRHLDEAGGLLDPFLAEPIAWNLEFSRLASEKSGLAAPSDELVAPERRRWSLREAATWLVVHADEQRVEELRAIGDRLIENANRLVAAPEGEEPPGAQEFFTMVRGWASGLDLRSYEARESDDGNLYIQSKPPEDVAQSMEQGNEDLRRSNEAVRLFVRYFLDPKKDGFVAPTVDEIVKDLAIARDLLENPPSLNAGNPWDTPVTVAAYALSTALLGGVDLPNDDLCFAAAVVLEVAEGFPPDRQYEIPESYFEQGGDRIAADVLPLLLIPAAASVRALLDQEGATPALERGLAAAMDLARHVAHEVRLHLARGMDPVWATPCDAGERCHHRLAVDIVLETVRDSVFGPWDSSARGPRGRLADPVFDELAGVAGDDIDFPRLDPAIRAFAPAAMADICVSSEARDIVLKLLPTQRRSMLAYDRNMDRRGSQALVDARALLMLARDGDDAPIYEHIDAFADETTLLNGFLRALSAAAEESPERGETAQRIWPDVVPHVLELDRIGHAPFDGRHDGDYTRASLLPNAAGEVTYLYRELSGAPLSWWDPAGMVDTVEAWVPGARGIATCVDQLISFLRPLPVDEQARRGVPWIATLVLAAPSRVARSSFFLATWLVEVRAEAAGGGLLSEWQRIVDALVVEGVSRLAPYSE